MPRKTCTLAFAVLLLSSLTASGQVFSVMGWSNGGVSDDPSNPDYGTHDWIAHHALDWLPTNEKQYILDNLAQYLYGTELPDYGIGDKGKHHVYYFANGTLQDNASAVRAQEEYLNAVDFFLVGDWANTSKALGTMSHYICDIAVFGHVMGNLTDWGKENDTRHDYYEDRVNTRTNSYGDEFNVYLVFDGVLGSISAYNAALVLANDTTFDVNGDLTCIWMDQNYNWDNATFRDRCGESINLAVNLLADVLHTFYMQVVPEFSPSIITVFFMVVTALIVLSVKRRKRALSVYGFRCGARGSIFSTFSGERGESEKIF